MIQGIITGARSGGDDMGQEPGYPSEETVGKEGDDSSPAMARDQGEADRLSGDESSSPIAQDQKTLSPANLDICKLQQ